MHVQFGETLATITIGLKSHCCGQWDRWIRTRFRLLSVFRSSSRWY